MTNKNTTTELLPCPFCGGDPTLNEIEPHGHSLMFNGVPIMPDYPGSWTIECCDVGMIKDTREEVVTAWNRRSPAHGEPSNGIPVIDDELIAEMDWCIENGHQGPRSNNLLKYLRAAITAPEDDSKPSKAWPDQAGKSLLRPAISVNNPLPPGCHCPPDHCGAPVIMGRQMPCKRIQSESKAGSAEQVSEREAFEKWVVTRDGHPFAGQFLNLMWAAWQARANKSAPERKALSDASIRELAHLHLNGTGDHCIVNFARALLAQASAQSTDADPPHKTGNPVMHSTDAGSVSKREPVSYACDRTGMMMPSRCGDCGCWSNK